MGRLRGAKQHRPDRNRRTQNFDGGIPHDIDGLNKRDIRSFKEISGLTWSSAYAERPPEKVARSRPKAESYYLDMAVR